MTSFVVLSHDGLPDEQSGEKTAFVRDAFSYVAFVVPVFWLLWHRLWFHAAAALLFTLLIFSLVQMPQFMLAIAPLNLLLGLLVALEGPAWRIAAFKRSAYFERGAVEAETFENAQLIWGVEYADLSTAPQKRVSLGKGTSDLIFNGGN